MKLKEYLLQPVPKKHVIVWASLMGVGITIRVVGLFVWGDHIIWELGGWIAIIGIVYASFCLLHNWQTKSEKRSL